MDNGFKKNRLWSWLGANGLFAYGLYAAIVNGSEIADWIIKGWLGFALTMVFIRGLIKTDYTRLRENGYSVPWQLDIVFDVIMLVFMLWGEWYLAGFIYFVVMGDVHQNMFTTPTTPEGGEGEA